MHRLKSAELLSPNVNVAAGADADCARLLIRATRSFGEPFHGANAFDGHRWDSPPKIRFAPDSPLEEAVSSELVSEMLTGLGGN